MIILLSGFMLFCSIIKHFGCFDVIYSFDIEGQIDRLTDERQVKFL